MAAVVIQPVHFFGLRTGVTNNLFFIDEQTVVYPCGNNCVRHNIDKRCQTFIPGTEKSQNMQALTISANRRYLAVSENGEKATITVYDLQHEPVRKRKILSGGDTTTQEFVCIAFSPNSKYLIGQAGGPEWTLIFWLWEKQKILATVTTSVSTNSVTQVSFNPYDNTQICVSGAGLLKLFRYSDGALKQGNTRMETINVLCHAWMTEELVIAGTDTGRLLLFESGDLRSEINIIPKPLLQDSHRQVEKKTTEDIKVEGDRSTSCITAILSYSMGFACSMGPGIIYLFDKTEKDSYRQTKEIWIPTDPCSITLSCAEQQVITSMCICPSEETLAISTDGGQLYSINLSSPEMSQMEQTPFDFLAHSFHSKPITGLSICMCKPLIATSSLDHSVRIWNYETNDLDLYKVFQEEAHSVALHPSGHFVLVGFSDKLRLMNLLINDIRTFKEFTVRGCPECSFSHGGHLFAAVNGNIIHIYSATTFENILNLKGHDGKVRAIAWTLDDSRLVSCGMDGAVYQWDTQSSELESTCVLKSCSYTGVAVSTDMNIFTIGTDHTLKEIQDSQILREVSSDDVAYTSIAMPHSGRVIFTGTCSGTIRAIKYPLPIHRDWNEYKCHCGPITKMVVTHDDQFLVAVSEDGSLSVWKIMDKESHGLQRDKEMVYTEEILITKSDLEEMNQNILELKTYVEELKMENEYQRHCKDVNFTEMVTDLSEKLNQQLKPIMTEIQVMEAEKEEQELAHLETITELTKRHDKELQDLESSSCQLLMLDNEKHQKLQNKCQRMQGDYKKQLTSIEESKGRALEELTHFYEAKLQEKIQLLSQCQDEARQRVQEFEEMNRQTEEVGNQEIFRLQTNYEKELHIERETNQNLKEEAHILKQKLGSLQKGIGSKCAEKERLKQEQQKLHGVISSLEKDIMGLKKAITERDETIQDKELTVFEMKKKNGELEKLRFFLDDKITDLEYQIEQRDKEIKELKEIIQEMKTELNQFYQKRTQLDLTISNMKHRLMSTDKEKQKEMQRVNNMEAYVRCFQADLHNTKASLEDPKRLKENLKKLYDQYIPPDDVHTKAEKTFIEENVLKEHHRHRQILERKMAAVESKMARDASVQRRDYIRIMKENGSLIQEVNELRMELRTARAKIHNYKLQIAKAKKPKQQSSTDLNVESPGDLEGSQAAKNKEAEQIIQTQSLEIQKLRQEILGKGLDTRTPSSITKLPALNSGAHLTVFHSTNNSLNVPVTQTHSSK